MNTILKIILLSTLMFLTNNLFAQKKEKGVIKTTISTEINASADKVWEIIGKQFAEIDKWSSVVITSKPVSFDEVPEGMIASRNSKVAGRITESERLEAMEILMEYSDENRSYVFEVANGPKFLAYARNNTIVTELGPNKSKVTFDVKIKVKGFIRLFKGKFKRKYRKAMNRVHNDLKVYAETGKPAKK